MNVASCRNGGERKIMCNVAGMKKKRLDRDLKWGFQHFPYYQMRLDCGAFHGLVCLIRLTDGERYYWNMPKAGQIPVCGKGMTWLQLLPEDKDHLITAMYLPGCPYQVSCWYVDVIEGFEYGDDGVAVYVDKYLDVIFTPQGDVKVEDRDELDEAYQAGVLSKEQYEGAIAEGDRILRELCADIAATERWCNEIRDCVEERICQGEPPWKK